MKKKLTKLAAMALCLALVLGSAPSETAYASNVEDQLNNLNSQYDELEKEQKRLQAEIDKAKSEKDRHLAKKQQLDGQMAATQQQINVLSERINILENSITEQELAIIEKQGEVDENYDKFKQRMRVTYMAGDASTVGLLLGAESFSEFLTRAEITSRIAQNDRDLINTLKSDLQILNEIKEKLDRDKKDVESSKQSMNEKKVELNGQILQVQDQIQDISALENQIKNNKAEVDKMLKEVENELQKIYASLNSTGEYTGGIMQWPVPNYPNITSYFGWRFNNTDYHTGIDISGANVYGKNIVAAADGVVFKVQLTYVANRGYGKFLIIDHGGGVTTLYGHTSEIVVSEGQQVKRGQTIAKVGSTGWSTGPHLHFEVRENNQAVNPLNGYLKK